jgi:hypothetical protein
MTPGTGKNRGPDYSGPLKILRVEKLLPKWEVRCREEVLKEKD